VLFVLTCSNYQRASIFWLQVFTVDCMRVPFKAVIFNLIFHDFERFRESFELIRTRTMNCCAMWDLLIAGYEILSIRDSVLDLTEVKLNELTMGWDFFEQMIATVSCP
jgi:hypothetical protein